MKKLWILFILVMVTVVTNAQGLVERYVRAIEILQTNLHFVYQGTYTPVQDITYHEFSADSLTWRKDFQEGDCYIRFANTTSNTTNPYTGLSGYHDDWWVFNFCTCNGAIQEGGGSVDTIFVDYGTLVDTVLVGEFVKIPQPDTITGSTVNYQDTLTHTHELVIYIGDNEDVDTTGVADGYVLKYNEITGNWEPHPDLIGAGASGELTVSEIDDDPSVENVVELVVPADHLENLGAGKVYLDLTLDPVNGENDYWRTDTVRVASGDTNIEFSSPLPAADYIMASLYAVLDNGNRQDLQYDSLATDGFKVLSVIDSAWVHYIAIRNVDSLLSTVADIGRVYASATDTTIGYLNQSVDDSTITVINQELTVINSPDADSLGGVAASAYLLSASYDSTFVWLNTDTLFVGSDTIVDNIIANYDTTGFRIDQSQITNLGSIDSIFTWVSVDTLFLSGDTAIAIQKEAPGLADNLILASKAYVDSTTIGAGGYTDEQAQDAVGYILADTRHVSFTYDDPTPYISATVDSTYVTFSLDTLFIGGDTILNTLIADYDTTGFLITENQISDLQNYLTTEVDGSTTNELNTGMSWNNGTNTIAVTDAGGSVDAVITGFLEAETDPIVGAVNGIVKANGAGSISAAVDGTDYNSQSLDDVLAIGNTSANTADFDSTLTVQMLKQDVLSGTETGDITHDVMNGNVGAYRVDNAGALVVNIHNLSSGVGGVIYLNIATNPSGITVNTFSDAGLTGLTEIEFGIVSSTLNKTTSIAFDCVSDGTNTYVMLTYGESN
jgi:hypothetical protein